MTRLNSGNKYGAVKTWCNTTQRWYDSKAEAHRGLELTLMQRAGLIYSLEFQPKYVLDEDKPKMTYTADFVYYEVDGFQVVEDVKGRDTEASKVRRRWLKQKYGIEVKIIRG